jgi:hypothetical protein
MMLESALEAAVGAALYRWSRDNGIALYFIKFSPQGVRGYPDRVILWEGGHTLFVEFKRKGQKPRKLQEYIHNQLRACGFKVLVHDDKDECLDEVKREVLATRGTVKRDAVNPEGAGGAALPPSGKR